MKPLTQVLFSKLINTNPPSASVSLWDGKKIHLAIFNSSMSMTCVTHPNFSVDLNKLGMRPNTWLLCRCLALKSPQLQLMIMISQLLRPSLAGNCCVCFLWCCTACGCCFTALWFFCIQFERQDHNTDACDMIEEPMSPLCPVARAFPSSSSLIDFTIPPRDQLSGW